MKETSKAQSPPYVRYLSWLTSPFPDFDFFFIKSVRRRAAELLELKPGDRVIDAGCGSGGSFPFLVAEIGDAGEVVGIEISPESTASARKRIAKNGWSNVSVLESPAEDTVLTGTFDGLLMFAAPDVYASDKALGNLRPYLKENSRIVFFGAKLTFHRMGVVLNPILRTLYKLSFSTTPDLDHNPWTIAEKYVEGLEIKEYFFGLMFLASGTNRVEKSRIDTR